MNKILTVISVIIVLVIFHTESFGAWWLEKEAAKSDRQELSDENYVFMLDDIVCVALKTSFLRNPDDSISEYRELKCWVSSDTYVQIVTNCELPLFSFTSLFIQKKKKAYTPALICGPKK